jgi:hypothetical protein
MEKRVVNKTTFTQRIDKSTFKPNIYWSAKKNGWEFNIEKYGIGYYILANRKTDNASWNSLWTNKTFRTTEDAFEFVTTTFAEMVEKNILNIHY